MNQTLFLDLTVKLGYVKGDRYEVCNKGYELCNIKKTGGLPLVFRDVY